MQRQSWDSTAFRIIIYIVSDTEASWGEFCRGQFLDTRAVTGKLCYIQIAEITPASTKAYNSLTFQSVILYTPRLQNRILGGNKCGEFGMLQLQS